MSINLSIIIPHFDIPEMLETLLASIPQDKGIQIIVVDDKSDVSHLKTIDKLKNKYNFEFYQNDRIKSAGSCRNIGLEKAQGKWVIFADSDDYFLDEFYNSVSKYFDSENEVVFFPPTSVLSDSGKIADRHLYLKHIVEMNLLNKSKKNEILLRYRFLSPCSKIIKKEFIQDHHLKFDEILYGNDMMFSTKVGHFMQTFEVSSDVIYCITRRYGSLTSNLKKNAFDMRFGVYVSYYKFLNKSLLKKEVNILDLEMGLLYFLLISFTRYGFKKFLKVANILGQENIKWFKIKYLNPIVFVRIIWQQYINYKRSKNFNKYYMK
jgi:glycosyltransferase involved in cell wall biosynthesis